MTVVAALELHDAVASRGRARHPQSAHGRFRSGIDEPHAFDRRHQPADAFSERDLERARRAEARAAARRAGDGRHEALRGVAVNQRSPRHDVIDECVAVDVCEA